MELKLPEKIAKIFAPKPIELTRPQFYQDIFSAEKQATHILMGEEHHSAQHRDNELRMLEQATKRGIPYQFAPETFGEEYAERFTDAMHGTENQKRHARDSLQAEIEPRVIFGNSSDFPNGFYLWRNLMFAFNNAERVVPIGFKDTDTTTTEDRVRHFGTEINKLNPDALSIVVLGLDNLANEDVSIQPHLTIPKDTRREVRQDHSYTTGISKISDFIYKVNRKL